MQLQNKCSILFKIRDSLPTNTLINVYNSLFMYFLQYGIIVWGQTSALYIEPIFKLQKKALRAISHEHTRSHTLPIFKTLKLLRLQDVFQLKMLSFVFESINKLNPMCFHDFFTCTSSIHECHTRHSYRGDVFLAHKNSLKYGLKSIRYMGAKMWNDLPVELRNSPSKHSFKKHLKTHILGFL